MTEEPGESAKRMLDKEEVSNEDEILYVNIQGCLGCIFLQDDSDYGPECVWLGEEIGMKHLAHPNPSVTPTTYPECPLLKGDVIIKRKE